LEWVTFSPDKGSRTWCSTTACFRKTFPLVARNRILSKGIDFSLVTRPVINPNFICFIEYAVVSYKSKFISIINKWHGTKLMKINYQVLGYTCSINNGQSIDPSTVGWTSSSLWRAAALICAEEKNSPT